MAGDRVSVRVRGRAGDERREYVYHFDLAETGGHDFVPRLWATRRVGALLDRVRVEGAGPELADEIRELGLSYGLVTPYTAFVIEGQAEGAASEENMALYDLQEVNQASGRVTIEARVQNQMYQQAAQANLATGANVTNYGKGSLAQVGVQQVDLTLLRGRYDLEGPISGEWLDRNVKVDRVVEFGSDEYWRLAEDPEARVYMQGGPNVVFGYEGEVIAVRESEFPASDLDGEGTKPAFQDGAAKATGQDVQSLGSETGRGLAGAGLLIFLAPVSVTAALIVLFAVGVVVYQGLGR
jgi:Ca-activated chloride channel family protein